MTHNHFFTSRCWTSSYLQSPFCYVTEHIHRFWGSGHRHMWGGITLPTVFILPSSLTASIFSTPGAQTGILISSAVAQNLSPQDQRLCLKHYVLQAPHSTLSVILHNSWKRSLNCQGKRPLLCPLQRP